MLGIRLTGSDLKRIFSYLQVGDAKPEPAMFIIREGQFGRSAAIPLSSAYKYDEPETMQEKFAVLKQCGGIAHQLGLPVDHGSLAHLAMFIADGLEDLIKMPSYVPDNENRGEVIGDITAHINGMKIHREIREND